MVQWAWCGWAHAPRKLTVEWEFTRVSELLCACLCLCVERDRKAFETAPMCNELGVVGRTPPPPPQAYCRVRVCTRFSLLVCLCVCVCVSGCSSRLFKCWRCLGRRVECVSHAGVHMATRGYTLEETAGEKSKRTYRKGSGHDILWRERFSEIMQCDLQR